MKSTGKNCHRERAGRSGPKASERFRGGRDTEERWHWDGDGGREGGEEPELVASCKEQTGKPSWILMMKGFCKLGHVVLNYFCISTFAKPQINFQPQLIKMRETRKFGSTQTGKWLHKICWLQQRGSGFKAHCCRVSLGLQSKNQHSQSERLNPDIQVQTFTRLCSFVSIFWERNGTATGVKVLWKVCDCQNYRFK